MEKSIEVEDIKSFLLSLIKRYTNNHEKLKIKEHLLEEKLVFIIKADYSDFKRLIGKGGRAVKSLQRIFKEWGEINNFPVEIRIPDPEPVAGKKREVPFDPSYKEQVESLANMILDFITEGEYHVKTEEKRGTLTVHISVNEHEYSYLSKRVEYFPYSFFEAMNYILMLNLAQTNNSLRLFFNHSKI